MLSESEIVPGRCYEVRRKEHSVLVVVEGQVTPNPQGIPGPKKWVGRCICVLDSEPVTDGEEIDLIETDFVGRPTKYELVRRCLLQGWRDNKDIVAYLADCGITVEYSTVGCYKTKFDNDTANTAPRPNCDTHRPTSTKAFGLEDVQMWQRFVDKFGGKTRVDAFLRLINAVKST